MRLISGLVLVALGAVAHADYKSGLFATTAEMEFRFPGCSPCSSGKPEKPSTFSFLYPSAIPGTVLIQQYVKIPGSPGMGTVCNYLVRGYAEDKKEFVAALKPENVLQFSCRDDNN